MKDLVKLGAIIRGEREKENLTQFEVMLKTGIAVGYYGNIENGRVTISPFHLYKLQLVMPGLVDRQQELYLLAGILVAK